MWIIDLLRDSGLLRKKESREWGIGDSTWFEMYVSVSMAIEKFPQILWMIRVLYTATLFTEDQSKPIEVEGRSYWARFKRLWHRTFKDEIKLIIISMNLFAWMALVACVMESSARWDYFEFLNANKNADSVPVGRVQLFMEYFIWLIPCSIYLTICA